MSEREGKKLKIKRGRPWFVFLIRRFIAEPPMEAVFTYGRTVYTLRPERLSADILAHERVHTRQQGRTPWLWWVRYLLEPEFRLRQEGAAYSVQFNETMVKDRNQRARWLAMLSSTLAGPMYGHIVSQSGAKALIESPVG